MYTPNTQPNCLHPCLVELECVIHRARSLINEDLYSFFFLNIIPLIPRLLDGDFRTFSVLVYPLRKIHNTSSWKTLPQMHWSREKVSVGIDKLLYFGSLLECRTSILSSGYVPVMHISEPASVPAPQPVVPQILVCEFLHVSVFVFWEPYLRNHEKDSTDNFDVVQTTSNRMVHNFLRRRVFITRISLVFLGRWPSQMQLPVDVFAVRK